MATFTDPSSARQFDETTHAKWMHEAKKYAFHCASLVMPEGSTHAGAGLAPARLAEAAGQVRRLALVPMDHSSVRLPLGNPGRSTVSAFTPLPVRLKLVDLIAPASIRETPTA